MMIEKLNVTNPISNIQKTTKIEDFSSVNSSDSVTLSKEAEKLAELHFATEVVKATSDVRAEKVAEMKLKFADPNYINSVIDGLADKIMEAYGL